MKSFISGDKTHLTGMLLTAISLLLFLTGINANEDSAIGIFFANHIITVVYLLFLLIKRLKQKKRNLLTHYFPLMVLMMISAYSLNRILTVFHKSPLWFSALLAAVCTAALLLHYFAQLHKTVRWLLLFIAGIGLTLFLYQSVYLFPVYPISTLMFFALGISLYAFTPLLFLLFLLIWFIRLVKKERSTVYIPLCTGIAVAVISVTIFTVRWIQVVNVINNSYRQSFADDNMLLPSWVRIAQQLPPNSITSMALKTGLTYVTPSFSDWSMLGSFPSRFIEPKIHNPFVVIATLVGGRIAVSENEKIKILESMYNSRHQTEERLWSDDGLQTTYINTTVQLWPQFRMAYTEQVMMIRSLHPSWRQGEAVYTFQLPEGSAVTSLSLWVNGEEEKAILTAKEKAEEAYRTIVGVEQRDPSLVTWNEGSRISVRVFPVTSSEERTFKIGITSPLPMQGNQLVYRPASFEGPAFSRAKQHIKVQMMQSAEVNLHPRFLKQTAPSEFESAHQTKYSNTWTFSITAPQLSGNSFCFDNHCYSVSNIQSTEVPLHVQNIYLDINKSWSKAEFDTILNIANKQNMFVFFQNRITKLTPDNSSHIFNHLQQLQFSLFPLHLITNRSQSLMVSKSTAVSPNLSDLENTRFIEALKKHSTNIHQPPFFLDIGNQLSPFLKTLREYRMLNYSKGNIPSLQSIIERSKFPQPAVETDTQVNIYDAGISITKTADTLTGTTAPDHLMRLFAYNHIMLQYAASWNGSLPETTRMAAEAHSAYTVSPVSSLVVLETAADYQRFNIEDATNSLKNASKNSKGAVPEPHQWILIIVAAIAALFAWIKQRR